MIVPGGSLAFLVPILLMALLTMIALLVMQLADRFGRRKRANQLELPFSDHGK